MKVRPNKFERILLSLLILPMMPAVLRAEITYAAKGKATGRVTISGKTPNTRIYIWQSDGNGNYYRTGAFIDTDANGDGTVSILNTSSSTLLVGHDVRIGDLDGPTPQLPVEVSKAEGWFGVKWFASVTPGMNGPMDLRISQTTYPPGHYFRETWEPNAIYELKLNPAQANWVNLGASVTTTGDLAADLLWVTNDTIRARVLAEPSHLTDDAIIVHNVGLQTNAAPWTKIDAFMAFQGNSKDLVDGALIDSHFWPSLLQYRYGDIYVIPDQVILPDSFAVLEGELFSGDRDAMPLSDDFKLVALCDADSFRTTFRFDGLTPQVSSTFEVFAEIEVGRPGLSFRLDSWNYQHSEFRQVGGGIAPTADMLVSGVMGAAYFPSDRMARSKVSFEPINDEDPAQDGWTCSIDQFYWKGS